MEKDLMNKEIDRKLRMSFLNSEEGGLFLLGCCMLIFWVVLLAVLYQVKYIYWSDLMQMTFSHMLAGRAAGILRGTSTDLPKILIAFQSIYTDVMVMFIIYPIIVFSYRNLVERRFFKEHVQPVIDAAQKSVVKFRRFKIAGIFFFVWFPFWMTGIIVGAVMGYLLGLRTWVNMTTVILGTSSAVISWVFIIDGIFDQLRNISEIIPTVITLLILIAILTSRILKKKKVSKPPQGKEFPFQSGS